MKRLSRYLPIFLLIGAFLLCLPAAGLAADTYFIDDGDILISFVDGEQYVTQAGVTKADTAPIITSLTPDTGIEHTITVDTTADPTAVAKFTLSAVNIANHQASERTPSAINIGASKAEITLDGGTTSIVRSDHGSAIHVTSGSLFIIGSGTLDVARGAGEKFKNNAAIGSGQGEAFSGALIFGDDVSVSVSNNAGYGAAIGSGSGGEMSGHILINTSKSVNVKSTGFSGSIGAGRGGSMTAESAITIGGTGEVTVQNGSFGVGIGVGNNSGNETMAGTITIQDSVTVKAYGGTNAAAIGSATQGKMEGMINIRDTAKVITGNTKTDNGEIIGNYEDNIAEVTGIIGDGNINSHDTEEGHYVIATTATLNGKSGDTVSNYAGFVNFHTENGKANGTPTNLSDRIVWNLAARSIEVTVDANGRQWVQYTDDASSKILDTNALIIQTDNDTSTENIITVETHDHSDYVAKLTLDGVNVNVEYGVHAIDIGASKAEITLAANSVNALKAEYGSAIHVTGNLSLVGSGKLNAENTYGGGGESVAATIGSGISEAFGGTMTFGDKVTVSVSNDGLGAAIGSGDDGEMSGHITITGEANIQNASANGGAAIGSGAFVAMSGHITITENANIVNASARNGAAIGSGSGGAMNGHILINTSKSVNAKSGMATASIGAGAGGSVEAGSTITIGSTGTVTAQSGRFGVGIGVGVNSGNEFMAGTITIQDGVTVKAYGGSGAAIGSALKGKMTGEINLLDFAEIITGAATDEGVPIDNSTGIIGDGGTTHHDPVDDDSITIYTIGAGVTLSTGNLPAVEGGDHTGYSSFVNYPYIAGTNDYDPVHLILAKRTWDLSRGNITIKATGEGEGFSQTVTQEGRVLNEADANPVIKSFEETANYITIDQSSTGTAQLTLDGVKYNGGDNDTNALVDVDGKQAIITLAAGSKNTVSTGYQGSAIRVNSGSVTVDGSGKLVANGSDNNTSALIGSRLSTDFSGSITIEGDVEMELTSHSYAACIGSGYYGMMTSEGEIVINTTGNVTATNNNQGAGIGAGYFEGGSMAGKITITTHSGQRVTATSKQGAGIGSGVDTTMGGTILIQGDGMVNASSVGFDGQWIQYAGAGIGAGDSEGISLDGEIIIQGNVTVNAKSRYGGTGIGGSSGRHGTMLGTITIQGNAIVNALGGESGAAIGSSQMGGMAYEYEPETVGRINILGKATVKTGVVNASGETTSAVGIIGDGHENHHDPAYAKGIFTIGAGTSLATTGVAAVNGGYVEGYRGFVNFAESRENVYDPTHLILVGAWDLSKGSITVNVDENGKQTVTQENGEQNVEDDYPLISGMTEANTITVVTAGEKPAQLALNGVNAVMSAEGVSPLEVGAAKANITLVAEKENTLAGGNYAAGIHVNSGSVTIDGDGTLTATGGERAAGIGTNDNESLSGSITINGSATVTAEGGDDGAGIGTGVDGSMNNGSSITINGSARATANGSEYGAGIGTGSSGQMNNGSSIVINGSARVTANGGANGAGIGAGSAGAIAEGASITIGSKEEDTETSHAIVTAKGSGRGTGIGSNLEAPMYGNITIQGFAEVTAYGGSSAAAIGSGTAEKMRGHIAIKDKANVTTGNTNGSTDTTYPSAAGIIGDGNESRHDLDYGSYTIYTTATLNGLKAITTRNYVNFVNYYIENGEPKNLTIVGDVDNSWDLAQGSITIKAVKGEGDSITQTVSQEGGVQNAPDANPVITTSEETANYITIDQGNTAAAQLTLDGVKYSDVDRDTDALVKVDGEDAIITLAAGSTNTVSTSNYGSAIRVNSGSVTVDGSGELVANGDNTISALIGSYYGTAFSGSITIEGDVEMELTSRNDAACIGSGYDATINSNGKIVINTTGNVTATNYVNGAGIGSGSSSMGSSMSGKITITTHSGQRVTATSQQGAGIGSGKSAAMDGTILIQGDGMVNASSVGYSMFGYTYAGAGIGAGDGAGISQNGEIIIQGNVTVNAKSRYGGTGIGSGDSARMRGTITIQDNAIVNALGGESGAAIGSSQMGGMAYGSDIGRINILGKATVKTGVVDASGNPTSAVGIIGDGHENHHDPAYAKGIFTIGAGTSLATTDVAAVNGGYVAGYRGFVNFAESNENVYDPAHLILVGTWDIGRGSITVNVDESGKQTVTQAGGEQNVEDDNPLIYGTTRANTITVVTAGEKPAQLTLMGVKATISSNGVSPLEVGAAKANITLAEGYENTLTGGDEAAGIHVNSGSVTIDGSGKLEVNGVYLAAGVGTNGDESLSGSITINGSATVTANGSEYGAGIGTGYGGHLNNGSSITINGSAKVNANGGANCAGIGTGASGIMDGGSSITINGSAKVNANGGANGAGIGTGYGGRTSTGASITIGSKEEDTETSHAIVTAKGSGEGTGIGSSGGAPMYGTITIQGFAEVTAYGGSSAAAIGSDIAETMRGSIAIKDNANVTTGNTNGSTDTTYANGARGIIGGGNESRHDVSVGSYTIYTTATLNGLQAITTRNYVNFVNYYIENGVPQNLTIEGDVDNSWDLAQGSITIKATGEGDSYTQLVSQVGGVQDAPDANPIITQTNAEQSTPNTITVDAASTAAAKFTLSGVNVSVTGTTHAIDVNEETAEITLAAGTTNRLNMGTGAGIRVSTGTLTLTGSGQLEAKGNGGGESAGAVIGSASREALAGTINIMGDADVTATSVGLSAAIGSGNRGVLSGAINIGGSAKVNATCSGYTDGSGYGSGAGIGSGDHSGITTTGSITISDTTSITASGSYGAAGIGSGREGALNGTITINTQNNVSATSGGYGAGIGNGAVWNGEMTGTIRITTHSGCTVTATSKGNGAGIGTGPSTSMDGTILINGNGVVNARSEGIENTAGAGIGAGSGGAITSNGTITIGGSVTVTANSKYNGTGIGTAGIGNTPPTMAGTITIKDTANVTAYGGENAAAIGSVAHRGMTGTISILDTATVKTGNYTGSATVAYPTATGIIGDGNLSSHDSPYGHYVIDERTTLNGISGTNRTEYAKFVNFCTADGTHGGTPLNLNENSATHAWNLTAGSIEITVDANGQQWIQYVGNDASKKQADAPVIMQSSNVTPTTNTIKVNTDAAPAISTAQFTLSGVNVSTTADDMHCIEMASARAEITLAEGSTNQLNADRSAAIHVSTGTLTITGSGKLEASSDGGCATIGSNGNEDLTGTISIIGNVDVTATNTDVGAGIGTGHSSSISSDGKINIGGFASVTASGDDGGAGIGSGQDSPMNGTITINTQNDVTATSRSNGAGIGNGGMYLSSLEMTGTINITTHNGYTVEATSQYGAGIGTGYAVSMGGDINIGGDGKLIATSGDGQYAGAGIGAGRDAGITADGTITISGSVNVTADSKYTGTAIGTGGYTGTLPTMAGTITIKDTATVSANGGANAAAIGSSQKSGMTGKIAIQGSPIVATGVNPNTGERDPSKLGIIGDGAANHHDQTDGSYVISTTATLNGKLADKLENYEPFVNYYILNGSTPNLEPEGELSRTWDLANGAITITVRIESGRAVQYVSQAGGAQNEIDPNPTITSNGATATNGVTIVTYDNATANLTIRDLTSSTDGSVIDVGASNANITVVNDGNKTSSLTSQNGAGIHIGTGKVKLDGSGTLNVSAGNGSASIGSAAGEAFAGELVIDGSTAVNATVTGGGAAIGSADGQEMSAGSRITIGGTSTVNATGGTGGTAIGGGANALVAGNIIIQGSADVTAQAGSGAAAIGSSQFNQFSGSFTASGSVNITTQNSAGEVPGIIGDGDHSRHDSRLGSYNIGAGTQINGVWGSETELLAEFVNFYIPGSIPPQTGDRVDPSLLLALCAASLISLGVLLSTEKRKRRAAR